MKKLCVVLIISLFIITNLFGQNYKQYHFKIDGTINADTGTVHLEFFTDYIPNKAKEIIARVKNNRFSISGYIPEPQSVIIIFDNRYVSSNFIIEKGLQTISINTDSTRKVPAVLNNTMVNEYPTYTSFFKRHNIKSSLYDQKQDSLGKLYNHNLPKAIKINLKKEDDNLYEESNKLLLRYSEKNPNSEIAFWKLIEKMSWGYEQIFDSINNAFSGKLKNGYAGRV